MDARSASTGRGSQNPTTVPSSGVRPPGQARGLGFPRAGRRLQLRLLHVYLATAPQPNAAPSLVLTDEAARVLDRIPLDRISHKTNGIRSAAGRPSEPETGPGPTFRAVVYALWNARRLGYRRVAVHCDDPNAVAQLNDRRPVDPDVVAEYLQIRALMHLYRSADIDIGELMLLAECATPPLS